ncbi:MAG TPA: hypothetical protein PKY59_25010 [Pyrinomonadaceae bacterium]|nr:hypothetical protein [Pyrinomonadaceae bacterium]
MNSKLLKIAAIGVLSFALFGCKSETANTNANANSAASGAAANTNANANVTVNALANANANANVKPVDNSPKRIAFNKGANWGAANITLAPGASQKFVVGAKSGQTMDVEVSAKETSVNLIKGKAQTTEDFGFLTAELQANGDYIFEVKNPTKKEIKTSVKVTIEGGKPEANEIDESDATVKDDEDVLPPPASKKDN